ncbi:MAG: hypothetical protein DRR16_15340 [Candidatus Parabeggiatoa sp. nov. 3]|nr:MAG: hypothetical protein DRR00_16395 [Gammaproteobacteria bacterium]RKZ68670.1 MAG: hypothetical protein DRQ99_03160 [Gammaproteobacteria bacterium]RKZ84210.1 MAG: hypothetical protein DRR16_15340 [Gammaproteobacteria bacterium]
MLILRDLLVVLGILGIGFGVLILVIYLVLFRWPRFNDFWKSNRRRLFLRQFIFYQSLGLSLLSVIIFLGPRFPSVMALEDVTMDFVMDVFYREDIPPIEDKIPPFVLLDIDDETIDSWGKPLFTPRNRLRNLIDAAVQAKARLIVVDVDVSQSMGELTLQPHDLELKKYLTEYVAKCQENQSACPPIILVRAFSELPQFGSVVPLIPSTGFLEDVVTTESAPYLQWGSAHFPVSHGTMRRWRLWEPTCKDKQPGMTPSIELLVMGMIRECTEDIQNALHQFQPQNCNGDEVSSPASVTFCDLTMSTSAYSVQRRIMFRIPWSEDSDVPEYPLSVSDNNGVPVLTIFSAQPYAELPPQANLDMLTDSIVVIGGSYGNADVHSTPMGQMPGALVIINAIHSLLQDITIKPMSVWKWLIIAAVFILVITLLSYFSECFKNSWWWKTRWWKYLWKILWGGVVISIIGGLFYVSIVLFEDGIWLNIAIPLLIIEIYRAIYQRPRVKKFANRLISW